jgi:hypothetical protein
MSVRTKKRELRRGRCFGDQALLFSKGGKIRCNKSTRDYRGTRCAWPVMPLRGRVRDSDEGNVDNLNLISVGKGLIRLGHT